MSAHTEGSALPELADIACVLFDLDGTLIDTAPDLGYAANLVRAEVGLGPLPLHDYRQSASGGARGLLGKALGIKPDDAEFPQRRDSFLAHYRANLSRGSKPFPGVPELLIALELKGRRWGVVTNKAGWLTRPLMDDLKLTARSASTISGDDVEKPKPAPDSLFLALKQLDLPANRCLYVGDDLRDIQAARAAGMPSVAAGWGYLGDSGPIAAWEADYVVATPAELAALLP